MPMQAFPLSLHKVSVFTSISCVTLCLLLTMASLLFAEGEKKQLIVKADQIVSKKETGTVRLTTYAKAIITQDDSTFTAENVAQRSEGNVHEFTCTGSPVFTDPENTITGQKLVAYSSPRRAEFSGNVKMVSTPKSPSVASGNEIKSKLSTDPTTITCDSLSYDYAGKKALAKTKVVIVQKERTLWADQGTYDQGLKLVVLSGNVRMKNEGKEEVKEMNDAETVTVSLENDWIDIVAKPGSKVEVIFEVEDDSAKSKP